MRSKHLGHLVDGEAEAVGGHVGGVEEDWVLGDVRSEELGGAVAGERLPRRVGGVGGEEESAETAARSGWYRR